MMSCCRCCGDIAACVQRHCCPGLKNAQRQSSYAKIEYSLVPDSVGRSQSLSSIPSLGRRETQGDVESFHAPQRRRHTYDLPQVGSQIIPHPQIDVTAPNSDSEEVVREQPSSRKPFLQRFVRVDAQDRSSTDEYGGYSNGDRGILQSLPVYRERVMQSRHHIRVPADKNPMLEFSLYYDLHQSKLRVHLQRAMHLPVFRLNSTPVRCDPVVVMHLEPDRRDTFRSQVVKRTNNPEFNQSFHFEHQSLEQIKQQTLVLRVYNEALNDKTIGKASLPLHDVELFGVIIQMKLTDSKDMESNFQGDLLVSLMYNPTTHEFNGMIHRATGLKKCDLFGKSDPFVKVVVTHKGEKVYRWKSTVKKKTLSPVYDESFSYQVTQDMRTALDVNDLALNFYIIDHDRLGQNDKMGEVKVGQRVNSELGRRHWIKLLQSPWQRISFWHPIELPREAPPSPRRFARGKSPY